MVTKVPPADAPFANGLSHRFRMARDHARLTQKALAQLTKRSESTISDIEAGGTAGGRMPQIDTVEVFARALGVSPGWLAYGESTAPPNWLQTDGSQISVSLRQERES